MNGTARRRWAPLLVAVITGVAIAGVATLAGIRVVRITSGSMEPTLSPGQFVVTHVDDDLSIADIGVGDTVLFRFPFGSTSRAVKRVVAVEGDRVEVLPEAVVVNGRRHPAQSPLAPGQAPLVAPERELPAGTVFLLGDNAASSIDSRSFGAVPEGELAGRVLVALPMGTARAAAVFVAATLVVALWRLRRALVRARRSFAPV